MDHTKAIVASLVVVVLVLTLVFVAPKVFTQVFPAVNTPQDTPSLSSSPSQPTPAPFQSLNEPTGYNLATLSPNPTFIAEEDLVTYALSLINSDRLTAGVQNVSLSNINSGQLHAEDMLRNGYFSHWDTQGYKPYMRYTLVGGKGAVSENIAFAGNWFNAGTSLKEALRKSEWGMMNDDAEWNWGHRDNIIDSLHNKVSIGIAYNNDDVYFVQDFEDDCISWNTLSVSGSAVLMEGTILNQSQSISSISIYFDDPCNLTVQQLENSPYNGAYNSGTFVGNVQSPPPVGYYYEQPKDHILIVADEWNVLGNNFDVSFDLASAFSKDGRGVYTLCLWTDGNACLTTYSVWNN